MRLTKGCIWLGAAIALAGGFLSCARAAREALREANPPPGKLVDAGGYRLHVQCAGVGPVTVIFEAGLNDFGVVWARVTPLLATKVRTCVYDRAGLGRSETSPHSPALERAVKDLGVVVASQGTQKPVVLVGHSYGAILIRMYQVMWPEMVAGLVLVDPASEDQADRLPGSRQALSEHVAGFRRLAVLSEFGMLALAPGQIPARGLNGDALVQYRTALAAGRFFESAAAESALFAENLAQAKILARNPTKGLPVVVLSRGRPDPLPGTPHDRVPEFEGIWAELQRETVRRVGAREHQIAKASGHAVPLDEPVLVAESVLRVVEAAASGLH